MTDIPPATAWAVIDEGGAIVPSACYAGIGAAMTRARIWTRQTGRQHRVVAVVIAVAATAREVDDGPA